MAETVTNQLISVRQAAILLQVSKMTIYRWADAKFIESQKVGDFLFIPQKEVDRIKKERLRNGAEPTGV